MILTDDQRRALAAFLRARRAALDPVTAGFPPGRRRTPGLRREEVAQRSGLSTTWYTWVEQARDIVLSEAALARLATALYLTPAERAYLFELAQRRDPAPPESGPSTPPPSLQAALQIIAAPAYLLDHLWRACGWNDPALHLFPDWLERDDIASVIS
jgi:transcriptional regulator with XRE-family HTH domain